MPYFLIIISYLIGSIPFGLLLGRLAGTDVRQHGSGNIGATNVSRLLGKKLGALTLACDLFKGLLPMLIIARLLEGQPRAEILTLLAGMAAFLGHCWPVYLKFKGGKGVATALGIFLYLAPLNTLGAVIIFIVVVRLSGFVSLGSMAAAMSMPLVTWFTGYNAEVVSIAGTIALLIVIKHHDNISRLLKGEEKSWKKSANGKKD
ncbi:MAG: glycerol-3-phosphate 1-O-acyltransferase PlsY [Thermodesulfobacteriota bacterium]